MAWKSGLKVPLLPLGPSCPLQTILLRDLVGCDSQLQIVMAISRAFFKIWILPNSHYSQQHAATPEPVSSNLKKWRQTAITFCSGLSHPNGWAALPSENISRHFFQMAEKPSENIKGLNDLTVKSIEGPLEQNPDLKYVGSGFSCSVRTVPCQGFRNSLLPQLLLAPPANIS